MKYCFSLILLIALAVSCKKNDPDTNSNQPDITAPDYTSIPKPETVNTELIGYVTAEDNILLSSGKWMHLDNQWITVMGNGMFYTGLVNTDKYNTKVFTEGGGSRDYLYLNYKSFPVTSALKNYVRFKVLKKNKHGYYS